MRIKNMSKLKHVQSQFGYESRINESKFLSDPWRLFAIQNVLLRQYLLNTSSEAAILKHLKP